MEKVESFEMREDLLEIGSCGVSFSYRDIVHFNGIAKIQVGYGKDEKRIKHLVYILMDISGSMDECIDSRLGDGIRKIDVAKKVLNVVLDCMDEMDAVEIITFNSESKVECELSLDRQKMKESISQLKSLRGTDISSAIKLVHSRIMLHQRDHNGIPFVLLITDGEANYGITNGPSIGMLVSSFQKELFGYPIYTFGVGQGHNSTFLQIISFNSLCGTYHYVKNPDSISEFIGGCLGGIEGTLFYFCKLSIQFLPKCRGKIFHFAPDWHIETSLSISKISAMEIKLGHLSKGEVKKIPFYISLTSLAHPKESQICAIVQLSYSCFNPEDGFLEEQKVEKRITVERNDEDITIIKKFHDPDEEMLRVYAAQYLYEYATTMMKDLKLEQDIHEIARQNPECATCKDIVENVFKVVNQDIHTVNAIATNLATQKSSDYSSDIEFLTKYITMSQIENSKRYEELYIRPSSKSNSNMM